MSIFTPAPAPWPSRVLSIVRIVFGLLFITFGTTKLFGWPSVAQEMPPIPAFSQIWIGAWMEVIGGILITIGLFTRPVAFILAGEMAVAYFQFHFRFPQAFWPQQNMGIGAVMYCWFFLYLVFSGAGVWSVDAAIARNRGERVGS
jgi:putative oxidoreductase